MKHTEVREKNGAQFVVFAILLILFVVRVYLEMHLPNQKYALNEKSWIYMNLPSVGLVNSRRKCKRQKKLRIGKTKQIKRRRRHERCNKER